MTSRESALRTALRYTEADLQANRQGRLSEMQAQRLQDTRRRNSALAALLFFALVIAASLFLYGGQLAANPLLSAIGSLLILVNALLSGFAGRSWMRIGGDLRSGVVEALAGDVQRVVRRGRAGDTFVIRLDGANLAVSREIFFGFEHEAPYRVYRSGRSGVLLAAEALRRADDTAAP